MRFALRYDIIKEKHQVIIHGFGDAFVHCHRIACDGDYYGFVCPRKDERMAAYAAYRVRFFAHGTRFFWYADRHFRNQIGGKRNDDYVARQKY